MTISELIKQLEGIREVEGDVEVFQSIRDNESQVRSVSVGKAEHFLEEEVYLGTGVEDYHQVVVLEEK